eukprot:jgi/Mesvir1/13862/Mv16004-RA.1
MVQFLLAHGADVHAANPGASSTPLHLAVIPFSDRSLVQTLFGGPKREPLPGQMETVRILLENGADPTARNANGKTPFDLAVEHKFSDVAMLIATWGPARAIPSGVTAISEPSVQAEAPHASSAVDTSPPPPPDVSACQDLQQVLSRYNPVLLLATDTQAIYHALIGSVAPMDDVRADAGAAETAVHSLEQEYERSKLVLRQVAACVAREPKSAPAIAARDEALARHAATLESLLAAYERKARLSDTRREMRDGLAGAQGACQGLESARDDPASPGRPVAGADDLQEALAAVGAAVEEYHQLLAPAAAETQAAVKQLQRCLERQHAAAQALMPRLVAARGLGGPLVVRAWRMVERETPGDELALARHLQGALEAEARQLAALARVAASSRRAPLRIGLLQRDVRALQEEAARLGQKQAQLNHPQPSSSSPAISAGGGGGAGSGGGIIKRGEAEWVGAKLEEVVRLQRQAEAELRKLLADVTNRHFLELYPEAATIPDAAEQLSKGMPSSALPSSSAAWGRAGAHPGGRGDDIYDPDWSLLDFRDGGRGQPLGHPRVRLVTDKEGSRWVIKELCRAEELRREGGRLRALQHPLVVRLERIFFDGELAYLQMPYCQNGSLRGWFESIKAKTSQGISLPIPERQQMYVTMRQVFQAVAFIHRKGVVHRDLKPENILLQDDGRIALCDFGVSHDVFRRDLTTTTTTTTLGGGFTAAYAAPEVLLAQPSARKFPFAQDLWSLGMMLMELATGDLPVFDLVQGRLELTGRCPDTGQSPNSRQLPSLNNRQSLSPNKNQSPCNKSQTPSADEAPENAGQLLSPDAGRNRPIKLRPVPSTLQQDPWMASLRQLSSRLLQIDPSDRPSAEDALNDPDGFLARDLAACQREEQRRAHAVTSFLESLRRSPSRSMTHRVQLAPAEDMDAYVGGMLELFSRTDVDRLNLLSTLAIECDDVRIPLSEAMERFFQGVVLPRLGLFEQGGGAETVMTAGATWLPRCRCGRAWRSSPRRDPGTALAGRGTRRGCGPSGACSRNACSNACTCPSRSPPRCAATWWGTRRWRTSPTRSG